MGVRSWAAVIVALLAATGCTGGDTGLGNADLARDLSDVLFGAVVTCEDREGAVRGTSFNRLCTFTREERTFESFSERTPRSDGMQPRFGGHTTTMTTVELRIQVVDRTWCEASSELPSRHHCA
jgi:hypothetical protein